MTAGFPYVGMPALCTQRCVCPLSCSAQTCCTLLSASGITVSTLFEMAPKKCFFLRVNEGQLTLLNFPKEHQTIVDSIPVSGGFIPCGFIYFLDEETAKLLLKARTLLCCVEK